MLFPRPVRRGEGQGEGDIATLAFLALSFFLVPSTMPSRSEYLKQPARLVVKIGTGVLTGGGTQLDLPQMKQLVSQVAGQHGQGREVVIVTSGAVGAGMGLLGYRRRPGALSELQACAAVGQSRLMSLYESLFQEFGLRVAQVLLTHADLQHHNRHLNARQTLLTLLKSQRPGIIPIVNENDAVSFTELKFGDNDRLSALVACLLPADLLVILTTVDGFQENFGSHASRTVPLVEKISPELEQLARGTTSATAVGGMASKLQAARIVMRAGIPLVIASGQKQAVLDHILAGRDEGTLFVPAPARLNSRKRWIAFFHHPYGSIMVDAGAKRALQEAGKSLLLPGIKKCEGAFSRGHIVQICDSEGREFARGISNFDSTQICARAEGALEVIHRDNLVLL